MRLHESAINARRTLICDSSRSVTLLRLVSMSCSAAVNKRGTPSNSPQTSRIHALAIRRAGLPWISSSGNRCSQRSICAHCSCSMARSNRTSTRCAASVRSPAASVCSIASCVSPCVAYHELARRWSVAIFSWLKRSCKRCSNKRLNSG